MAEHDWQGGIFVPVEKLRRPVYTAGPDKGQDNLIFYTCPVSAIPPEVWDLLHQWWNCRLLKCLPYAGGFQDQPKLVRDSFPFFEMSYQVVERQHGQQGAALAAQAAVVGLMAAMHGGR